MELHLLTNPAKQNTVINVIRNVSVRRPTAVDDQAGACHQCRCVRSKKQDCSHHIFYLTDATEFDFGQDMRLKCRVIKIWLSERRFYEGRRYGIAADAVACQIESESLVHPFQRPF